MLRSLVFSEMCIRPTLQRHARQRQRVPLRRRRRRSQTAAERAVSPPPAARESQNRGLPGCHRALPSTVAQAKVSREQVRAQNKETLQAIIDNTNLSDAEKQDAVAQMVQMTELSEQENAIETLMATKGFSEAVVSLTEDSADVVVKADELTDANRAQIEDIVTRKTDIAPENIVITPIHE